MTRSLEGWPTKAKEAPSPHEVRLPLLPPTIPRRKVVCTWFKKHEPRLRNDLSKLSLRCLNNFSWNTKFMFDTWPIHAKMKQVRFLWQGSSSLSTTDCLKWSTRSPLVQCQTKRVPQYLLRTLCSLSSQYWTYPSYSLLVLSSILKIKGHLLTSHISCYLQYGAIPNWRLYLILASAWA